MFALYKKELSYYFNNPVGYIIVVLFAAFANFLYVKDIFIVGSASMRQFFTLIPWLMMVFVPALTMRSISEEKRTNTLETLLTLPISETQVVLAKFAAVATVIFIGLLLTIGLPISLFAITSVTPGTIYLPEIAVGYIGAFFMSLFFASLSLFFSSLSRSQVVSFMSSLIVLFFLVVLSQDFLASALPGGLLDALRYFSPVYHLETFVKGLIDARAVTYFVTFTVLFTFLTIIDLEKRS